MGLLSSCRVAWEQGAHLVALWGTDERDRERGYTLNVVVDGGDGLVLFELTLPAGDSTYPDLGVVFPAANRMQRATYDLLGIASEGDTSDRGCGRRLADRPISAPPRFRGAREMATGPGGIRVRARRRRRCARDTGGPGARGIIEPGRFRFQIVGEKVLRLEERLGFTHKGIEKRFEAMAALTGHRLAGQVSGDSTVAYAWAYAQALGDHRRGCTAACAVAACARLERSASPIIWATSAISATTAGSLSASRSSRG
jgi:hypothetical protein